MELTMPIVVSGTRLRCGKYKVKTYHYIVAQSKIVHMGYLVRHLGNHDLTYHYLGGSIELILKLEEITYR